MYMLGGEPGNKATNYGPRVTERRQNRTLVHIHVQYWPETRYNANTLISGFVVALFICLQSMVLYDNFLF